MELKLLSSWLSIEEAAIHLKSKIKQNVTPQNIYQLAINKQLRIAVKVIGPESAFIEQKNEGQTRPDINYASEASYERLDGTRWFLSDMPSSYQMLEFLERYGKDYHYAALINSPVILESLDGTKYAHLIYLIRKGLKTMFGKAMSLPDDHILEVSREELDSLIEGLETSDKERKQKTSQSMEMADSSHLVLIGALTLALSKAKPDLLRGGKPNASGVWRHLLTEVFEIDSNDVDIVKNPRNMGKSSVNSNIQSGLRYIENIDLANINLEEVFETLAASLTEVDRKK